MPNEFGDLEDQRLEVESTHVVVAVYMPWTLADTHRGVPQAVCFEGAVNDRVLSQRENCRTYSVTCLLSPHAPLEAEAANPSHDPRDSHIPICMLRADHMLTVQPAPLGELLQVCCNWGIERNLSALKIRIERALCSSDVFRLDDPDRTLRRQFRRIWRRE